MNNILAYPYNCLRYISDRSYSLGSETYHIALAIIHELSAMYLCGWNRIYGNVKTYGANPDKLSEEDKRKTPILLLHGSGGDETNFIPLLQIFNANKIGPIYTLNYSQATRQEQLKKTIEKIQTQYEDVEKLEIILIGHSLGGITAVEYTFGDDQLPNVIVKKVIAIASRLRNIPNARFRCMYDDIIPIVNKVENEFSKSIKKHKAFAIIAKRDWLLPQQACQLPNFSHGQTYEIEDYSHLSVLFAPVTTRHLIFLTNNE